MTQTSLKLSNLKLNLQNSEPSRKVPRSFGSSLSKNKLRMGLQVDLSDEQIKKSEEICIPLSTKNMIYNQLTMKNQTIIDEKWQDKTIDDQEYLGVCLMRGELRKTQEDRFLIKESLNNSPQNSLFAVFDGHQGSGASDYCSENLPRIFEELSSVRIDACSLLHEVFQRLDNDYLAHAEALKLPDCGTTCVTALIANGRLSVASVGDSTAFVIRQTSQQKMYDSHYMGNFHASGSYTTSEFQNLSTNNFEVLELTNEHNPETRIDEYLRITQAGGKIIQIGESHRVEGILEVTRSIGDRQLKKYVVSQPETTSIQLSQNDTYLVLASDGIFKTFSKEQIVGYIIQKKAEGMTFGQISQYISELAHQQSCPDNTTLVIVDLQHYYNLNHQNLINGLEQQDTYNLMEYQYCNDFDLNCYKNDAYLQKQQSERCNVETIVETEDSSTENSVDMILVDSVTSINISSNPQQQRDRNQLEIPQFTQFKLNSENKISKNLRLFDLQEDDFDNCCFNNNNESDMIFGDCQTPIFEDYQNDLILLQQMQIQQQYMSANSRQASAQKLQNHFQLQNQQSAVSFGVTTNPQTERVSMNFQRNIFSDMIMQQQFNLLNQQ
eukprot:403356034